MDKKSIKVKAFGMVAEKTGSPEWVLTGVEDTDQLLEALYRLHPGLEGLKFAIAVNRKIAHTNTRIEPNSEIALLPPFSGG